MATVSTKHKIGAFQAKNTLGTLLDWVEAGDEVVITRRGKNVARLVNARSAAIAGDQAAEAAARIRRRARSMGDTRMSWSDWRTLREEGRR